jgi:hypothetical protein
MLYGANIATADPLHRLDLVVINQYQWNRGDAMVIGSSDIDSYAAVDCGAAYRRLDRTSWDVIDEFETCDDLLTAIFSAQVEALERAG